MGNDYIIYCKKCGSLVINGLCSNRACKFNKISAVKKRRWKIGDDFIYFSKPVTFLEAKQLYVKTYKKNRYKKENKDGEK